MSVTYCESLETTTRKMKSLPVSDYKSLCEERKSIFEQIPDDRPVKLYADFDFKPQHAAEDYVFTDCTEQLIDVAKSAISKVVSELGGQTPPEFAVKTATVEHESNWVMSFHIICTNYTMTKLQQSEFFKRASKYIDTDPENNWRRDYIDVTPERANKGFFDMTVYTKNRRMRSAYSTKEDESRHFEITEGTFEDTIISVCNRDSQVLTIELPERKPAPLKSISIDGLDAEEINAYLDAGLFRERAFDYKSWMDMAFAINNVLGISGLGLFDKFSRMSSLKYDADSVRQKYESLQHRIDGLGMGSIKKWAKDENPEVYARISREFWEKRTFDKTDLHTKAFTTGLLSDYFKDNYGHKFVCVNEMVYHYNGIYWERDDRKKSHLTKFVDKQIYSDIMAYCSRKTAEFNGKENNEKHMEKIAELQKNAIKTRQNGFRKGVIEDIITAITNNRFEFDIYPHLFAFRNAIYDLRAHKFIDPEPSQKIATVAEYDYVAPTQSKIDAMNSILRSILPNETIRNYYLSALATGMIGTQNQEFFIATGIGGNGKSLLNTLFMSMLSSYGYTLPQELLQNNIREGANPEVAGLHKKRFALMQEPSAGKKIKCAALKAITGNSSINARQLYATDTNTILQATFVMECNTLPLLDEVNPAIIRRIRAVKFNSVAVTKEEYDSLENPTGFFVKNSDFVTDEWRQSHREALFEIIAPFCYTPMPEVPTECAQTTSAYMASSDDLYAWFSERYQRCEEGNFNAIKIMDLFDDYKQGEIYQNLSKLGKRQMTKTFFEELIQRSIFLRRDVKQKNERYNHKQLAVISIVGWERIERDPHDF